MCGQAVQADIGAQTIVPASSCPLPHNLVLLVWILAPGRDVVAGARYAILSVTCPRHYSLASLESSRHCARCVGYSAILARLGSS